MKQIICFLLMIWAVSPLWAQSEYISKSRRMEDDRFEDLDGNGGVLLLSKRNDLIISVTNSKKKASILSLIHI